MAKKVRSVIKLQIEGGKATPAPPVGPALGQHGLNIMAFVKEYNARTAQQMGMIVPVELTIFEDSSFTFILKSPPAASLLLQAAGIEKGSGNPLAEKRGTVTSEQVRQIAQTKMQDLNAADIDGAMKIIEGTARSIGIQVQR